MRKIHRIVLAGIVAGVTLVSSSAAADTDRGLDSIIGPADPTLAPAVRLDPPTVQAPVFDPADPPTFASDCDEMSWYRQQAGLPAVFDRLGFRESRCENHEDVHTSCCWGWWQLSVALHLRDPRIQPGYARCGVTSRFDVDSDTPGDKWRQACAAKVLYDVVGLSGWAI